MNPASSANTAKIESPIGSGRKKSFSQKEQLHKTLSLMLGENDLPPLFYDVHELSSLWKMHSPKKEEIIKRLKKAGFVAGFTHYSPTGFRTNAPVAAIKKAFAAAFSGSR